MNSYEQKQQERKERLQARADRLKQAYYDRRKRTCMQFPGSVVAGPANYPVARHNKAHALVHKAYDVWQHAQSMADKAGSTCAISGFDPDAVEKLQAELEQRKANQERMKMVNKIIRANKAEQRVGALINAGFTPEESAELLKPDCFGYVGFQRFELSNNNANIKRISDRIKILEALRTRPAIALETEGYTYKEEDNRAQFIFNGKPDPETCAMLKRNAFKWSPSRGAWVRQLTPNALRAVRAIREALATA